MEDKGVEQIYDNENKYSTTELENPSSKCRVENHLRIVTGNALGISFRFLV